MATTRTYEDFAGTLGRRVARVKEACGGAVGKKQYGGVQERPKSDEELKAAIIKADRLDRDRSEDGQRRLWAFLSGYPEIAVRYGTNPDQNLDWEPEAWFSALADYGVDTTGVAAWRRKYTPERADSLARMAYGVKDGAVQTKGKGGNIMNYTVYFKDGGLLPRSQRRVYQTGGKASAKDIFNALQQGAQILLSGQGSKQQQQQAQQIYMQVIEAYQNGDPQAKDILNTVFSGVEQGKKEFAPIAQVFQSIMQQMQKREFGGRLDYITMLRNGGRPRYRTGGVSRSYQPGDEMEYEGEERTPGFFGRLGSRYNESEQRAAQRHQNIGEKAQAYGNAIDDKLNEIGDMTLRDVGNGIVKFITAPYTAPYKIGKSLIEKRRNRGKGFANINPDDQIITPGFGIDGTGHRYGDPSYDDFWDDNVNYTNWYAKPPEYYYGD